MPISITNKRIKMMKLAIKIVKDKYCYFIKDMFRYRLMLWSIRSHTQRLRFDEYGWWHVIIVISLRPRRIQWRCFKCMCWSMHYRLAIVLIIYFGHIIWTYVIFFAFQIKLVKDTKICVYKYLRAVVTLQNAFWIVCDAIRSAHWIKAMIKYT